MTKPAFDWDGFDIFVQRWRRMHRLDGMLLRPSAQNLRRLENCHEGQGALWCSELLADYAKRSAGFAFIHDNVIDPGASIGEHGHENEEEIYVILSGQGSMRIDGVDTPVIAGDVCLTRSGHSHSLVNGGDAPMRFLVIHTRLGSGTGGA